ncbi:glycosyltransferase [Streptomyces griseoluteus]|uniref:glycosyltransferase n=1 Tax=Streptomyces griseoluteus TaxID=29306 RepID=UPI003811F8E8
MEDEIRRRISSLLAPYPQAARRLALLPALPNTEVRRLQRALAQRTADACCWYVCPSAKEEFGIAILEAMDAGLPVAGPRRGGVAHYLRDQVNGLLMDISGQEGPLPSSPGIQDPPVSTTLVINTPGPSERLGGHNY